MASRAGGHGGSTGCGRGGGRQFSSNMAPMARHPGIHFPSGSVEWLPTGDRSSGPIPNIVVFLSSLVNFVDYSESAHMHVF